MSNVAPETSRNSSENENTHPINWEMISFDDDLRNDLKSALEVVQQRNDIQIEYSGLAESELASALSEVSVQSGVPIHRVRLRPGWHRANHGDMLVLVNQNNQPRLCALLHANSGYIVHDFRQGSVKKLDAATRKQLAPFGWTVVRTFENSESFQGKFSQQPILLGELFKYLLHGIRKHSKLLLMTIVASIGLSFIAPLAFKQLIDIAVPVADADLVIAVTAALVFVNVSEALLGFLQAQTLLIARSLLTQSAQESLWWRVIHLPFSFFRNRSSGELVHQSMMFAAISKGIGTHIVQAGMAGMIALFSGLFALWLSPKLMLYAAPLAVIEAVVVAVLIARIRRRTLRLETYRAKLSGQVTCQLNGIIKIQSAGAEKSASQQSHELNEVTIREDAKIQFLEDVRGSLAILLPAISMLIIFMIGFSGVTQANSVLGLGTFVAFIGVYRTLTSGISGIANLAAELVGAREQLRLVRPFLNAVPIDSRKQTDVGRLSGAVRFQDVYFSYNRDSANGVRNVNFECRPGEFLGLVGDSGSGKSTIIRLIFGLEADYTGQILLDGLDIRNLNMQRARKEIGFVLQTSKLFDGTIRDNICIGRRAATDQVLKALERVELRETVEGLPLGLETPVSQGGGNFSGGQAQRLLIARAILDSPRMLVFDESLNGLDRGQQIRILDRVNHELGCTLIVVSHRRDIFNNADRLYRVTDNGLDCLRAPEA